MKLYIRGTQYFDSLSIKISILPLANIRILLFYSIDEATSGQQLHTAYQHVRFDIALCIFLAFNDWRLLQSQQDDWTLLQFAASTGDIVAVKTILAGGIDADSIGVRQVY